jgi:hypothetical protein
MHRSLLVQFWILFTLILANFLAQIVYYFHLYYSVRHPFPALRSTVLLGLVFILFLAANGLLIMQHKAGRPAILFFLSLEFFFYLWNIAGGVLHGFGWFFNLSEPDPILRAIFAIGYLSFLACGYFMALLLFNRPAPGKLP